MALTVREMTLEETQIRIEYFHQSTPDFLSLLGVDPAKLPTPDAWYQAFAADFARPLQQRNGMQLLWLLKGVPVGMCSVDNIQYGAQAFMHLHVLNPHQRKQGIGTIGIQKSIDLYFDQLKLKRLYCQPNALNVAPNRALQKAGFRYVKSYQTTPGPINTHQVVTQWVYEA